MSNKTTTQNAMIENAPAEVVEKVLATISKMTHRVLSPISEEQMRDGAEKAVAESAYSNEKSVEAFKRGFRQGYRFHTVTEQMCTPYSARSSQTLARAYVAGEKAGHEYALTHDSDLADIINAEVAEGDDTELYDLTQLMVALAYGSATEPCKYTLAELREFVPYDHDDAVTAWFVHRVVDDLNGHLDCRDWEVVFRSDNCLYVDVVYAESEHTESAIYDILSRPVRVENGYFYAMAGSEYSEFEWDNGETSTVERWDIQNTCSRISELMCDESAYTCWDCLDYYPTDTESEEVE